MGLTNSCGMDPKMLSNGSNSYGMDPNMLSNGSNKQLWNGSKSVKAMSLTKSYGMDPKVMVGLTENNAFKTKWV